MSFSSSIVLIKHLFSGVFFLSPRYIVLYFFRCRAERIYPDTLNSISYSKLLYYSFNSTEKYSINLFCCHRLTLFCIHVWSNYIFRYINSIFILVIVIKRHLGISHFFHIGIRLNILQNARKKRRFQHL